MNFSKVANAELHEVLKDVPQYCPYCGYDVKFYASDFVLVAMCEHMKSHDQCYHEYFEMDKILEMVRKATKNATQAG